MMSSKRRHILHQQSHILCYSLPPFNRLRARQIPMVTIRSPEQNSSRTSLSKSFQVQRVSSHEELHMAHAVRRSVFTKEMGIPENVVFDEMDEWGVCPEIFHFIAYRDDKAIGTARISRTRNGCQLERMAIDADFRGLGAGKALLDKVEQDEAIWSSMGPLFCHAKAQKESFYTRFGWVVEEGHSDIDHTGTPHVVMVRRRRPRGAAAVNGHALSHVMVKTKDISKAMKFYSLLGYETKVKFLSQGLKCAWIESPYIEQRIELIDTSPELSSDDMQRMPRPSLADPRPGFGHISIDLSRACTSLARFLDTVQNDSIQRFQLGLRVIEAPRQIMIGKRVMEVAFITDPDGVVIELMRYLCTLEGKDHFDNDW